MATYCLVFEPGATWDDAPENHFKTRREADARLAELAATGRYVAMWRWEDHKGKQPAQCDERNA